MDTWREELAWAAGFFDGEGSTYYHGRVASQSVVKMHVGQKDRRALDRFRAAVGVGKVYGPNGRVDHSVMFDYVVNRHEEVQAAVAMLWTFLGPVKREQARAALALSANARALRADADSRCAHGHDFTPRNTRVYVWNGKRSRFCRDCGRRRYYLTTTAQRLPTEAFEQLVRAV